MVKECENCGYMFESEENICPICHSEDVIEYEEEE